MTDRRSAIRRRFAYVLPLFGLLLLTSTGSAAAADFRSGDSLMIGPAEQVTDSLYAAARDTTVAGRVTGDVIATGDALTISGRVDGGVNALVADANITGTVGGSVRIVGGTVTIAGQVSGDVLVGSGTLDIEKTGSVSGDVILTSGTLIVDGPVAGEIRGNASEVSINATVGGGVDVAAKAVRLGSLARIVGGLTYTSPDLAVSAPGAAVTGTSKHTVSDRFYPGSDIKAWLFSPLFRLLSMLVTGVLIVLTLPALAVSGADGIRRSPILAILLGVLAAVLTPVAIVLIGVTVVGLPAALLGLAGYVIVLYLSQIFAGLAIGRWIMPKSWDTGGRGYNLLAMAIGVVLIGALRLVPIDYFGRVVSAVVGVMALGGVVSATRHVRRGALT